MEMFFAPPSYRNLFALREYVDDFNNRKKVLTSKLLKHGYRYHKLRKAFSKFYYSKFELIVKYTIRLKTLLQQVISETVFYGD